MAEAPVRQPKDNVRPSATPYVGLPKGQTCVRTGLVVETLDWVRCTPIDNRKGQLVCPTVWAIKKTLLWQIEKSPAVFLNKAGEKVSNMNVVYLCRRYGDRFGV